MGVMCVKHKDVMGTQERQPDLFWKSEVASGGNDI